MIKIDIVAINSIHNPPLPKSYDVKKNFIDLRQLDS